MPPRSPGSSRWLFGALAVIAMITAVAAPIAAQAQGDPEATTVSLVDIGDSGVSGVATLEPDGDQTNLTVRLTGAFDDHLISIASGSCTNVDPAEPESGDMAWVTDPDGFIDTAIPLPLDELEEGNYSITVRRSEAQPEALIACGNIGEPVPPITADSSGVDADSEGNGVAGGADAAPADPDAMPVVGVGSASQPDRRLAVIVAGLATLAAAIAIATARRPPLGSR